MDVGFQTQEQFMHCNIELLDKDRKAWFTGTKELPGVYILKLAAARKPAVMEKGLEFAQGTIPFSVASWSRSSKSAAQKIRSIRR